MGELTGVEWAKGPHNKGGSWNPWMGCHKISPACAHCYMFREMRHYGRDPETVVRTRPQTFNAPLKWVEPQGVFTCSWSDFLIKEADAWRNDAVEIIAKTPHTYMILTKRIERMTASYSDTDECASVLGLGLEAATNPRVWFGVSVENPRFYSRIEHLQRVKCAGVRFLSIEPLLGRMEGLPLAGIGWVIVGGESGPGFRPLNLDWAREIRDRCVDLGIPFFFKQKSGFQPKGLDRLLDGREWNEFPAIRRRVGDGEWA